MTTFDGQSKSQLAGVRVISSKTLCVNRCIVARSERCLGLSCLDSQVFCFMANKQQLDPLSCHAE